VSRTAKIVVIVVAVLLAGATVAIADAPLLAQWHLDFATGGVSGDVVYDSGPNAGSSGSAGDNLTGCVGCIHTSTGRFGNALDPSTTGPLTFSGGIRPTGVTVLAWVRRTGAPGSTEVIAAQAYDSGSCDLPSYRLEYSDADVSSGFRFAVHAGGAVVSSPAVSTPGAFDGQWHLVTGTYDGAKVHMYLDGNELGSGTAATGPIEYGTPAGAFGADGFTGNSPGCFVRGFSGGIDELRVYSRALSSVEIRGLANASGSTPPDLVPDQDGDGVPDASDNCPSTPNPSQTDINHDGIGDACQSDSDHDGWPDVSDNCPNTPNPDQLDQNHNGVGAACEPTVAHFQVAPNPTCTGVRTTFDGRSSSSDSPIVSYEYSYSEEQFKAEQGAPFGGQIVNVDQSFGGSSPVQARTFDWNIPPAGSFFGDALRESVDMFLTVTTASGESASSDGQIVDFVQGSSLQSRTGCPAPSTLTTFRPSIIDIGILSPTTVSVTTGCPSAFSCLGSGTISYRTFLKLSSRRAIAAKKKKSKGVLLGAARYTIAAHHTAKIKISLNKRGKRLLKRKHKLKTTVTLRTVSVTGKTVTLSRTVTFKQKAHKKP
jgi:hypothetical protein